MATSGNIDTSVATDSNMYFRISWSRSSVDTDNMTVTYTFNAEMRGDTNMLYRCYANDYIKVKYNGTETTMFSQWYPRGSGQSWDPFYAYISVQNPYPAYIDNTKQISNWLGMPNAWVHGQGHLVSNYSITMRLNEDGKCPFTIDVSLTGYNARYWRIDNNQVNPDAVDVYSRTPYKTNDSWNTDGRIWHKESGVWRKRKLFKKENGTWVKK